MMALMTDHRAAQSVLFFERQFERQIREREFALNPFETAVLPHLRGRVLDFGCGLGNLAFEAAARGCSVLALDASEAAIAHVRRRAASESAAVQGTCADLRNYEIGERFDAVVSIGLLMFFDCPAARSALGRLQAAVRPGGIAAINVLVQGTTYLDMFGPDPYCLFARGELEASFAGWEILYSDAARFDAPGGTVKAFETIVARRR
jgi:tellurite methyltransferase